MKIIRKRNKTINLEGVDPQLLRTVVLMGTNSANFKVHEYRKQLDELLTSNKPEDYEGQNFLQCRNAIYDMEYCQKAARYGDDILALIDADHEYDDLRKVTREYEQQLLIRYHERLKQKYPEQYEKQFGAKYLG